MAERPASRLVAYFGNRYLHHFERDLEEIREHGFDAIDLGRQHLLAQVAAGVDHHAGRDVAAFAKPFQQKGTSEAPVAGFVGVAITPDIADARHAA